MKDDTQAKIHAALASLSWTEYKSAQQVAEIAGVPAAAAANALRALVRRGFVKEYYVLSASPRDGARRSIYRIIRRNYQPEGTR